MDMTYNANIRHKIPNLITLCNMICGFIGIIFVLRYAKPLTGILFMFIAAFFDLFDGLSARLLNARSNIGKELDSLCDVVSFGVLPGTLMFYLMEQLYIDTMPYLTYLPFVSFIIPIFAAYRLAIFNTNEQKTSVFSGLSSPGAAFFFASLILNDHILPFLQSININLAFILIIAFILILCILMVSHIKFLSLKFESFSFKDNYLTYIFYVISIALLIIFGLNAMLYILIFYIILSLIFAK